jgi:hypothetical protein
VTDGSVTTNKIADGAVTTSKVTDGSVTTNKIADGAVTDAKITGPISSSKISSTGLDADSVDGKHASDFATVIHTHNQSDIDGLIDALSGKSDVNHNHDGVYQRKYSNIAIVAKSGGDYTDPVSAMNDYTAWCGIPSSSNPCLLKIMPGVYDIGTNNLAMQSYIAIEGSGEGVTKITGNNGTLFGVINAASNSEIRFLTIENTNIGGGSGFHVVGINVSYASPEISHVTITSSSGMNPSVTYGIRTESGSPTLNDVNIIVTGFTDYGIYDTGNSSDIVLNNVTISAVGQGFGIRVNETSSLTVASSDIYGNQAGILIGGFGTGIGIITHSTIEGGQQSIINSFSSSFEIKIGLSQAIGPVVSASTVNCYGVYDENYTDVVCP